MNVALIKGEDIIFVTTAQASDCQLVVRAEAQGNFRPPPFGNKVNVDAGIETDALLLVANLLISEEKQNASFWEVVDGEEGKAQLEVLKAAAGLGMMWASVGSLERLSIQLDAAISEMKVAEFRVAEEAIEELRKTIEVVIEAGPGSSVVADLDAESYQPTPEKQLKASASRIQAEAAAITGISDETSPNGAAVDVAAGTQTEAGVVEDGGCTGGNGAQGGGSTGGGDPWWKQVIDMVIQIATVINQIRDIGEEAAPQVVVVLRLWQQVISLWEQFVN